MTRPTAIGLARATMRGVAVLLVIGAGASAAVALGVVRSLAPRVHARWLPRLMRAWCRVALWALGVTVVARGGPVPGGVLLVGNHVSWLDILVLGSRCGSGFVAKAEVARWPALGWLARCADTLFIARGDRASAAQAAERIAFRLRAGQPVMLFPEGTTSDGRAVGPFRHRLVTPAVQAHALVQAAAIAYGPRGGGSAPYVGDDSFLPHLLRVAAEPGVDARVGFCRPRLAATDARAVARVLESDVRRELADLRGEPQPHDAAPGVTLPSQTLHRLPG